MYSLLVISMDDGAIKWVEIDHLTGGISIKFIFDNFLDNCVQYAIELDIL